MLLREAELMNMNYLDYLINEWHPREKVQEYIQEQGKKPVLNNIKLEFPSLSAFINKILFENYILKFGEQFCNGEIENGKLFLYHGTERFIIVIRTKQNKHIMLSSSGDILSDISEKERKEIRKRTIVGTA